MMRILALLTTLSLISTAYVQVRDDFNGGFSQQWRWTLPQNDPFCTLFDNAVSFTSNSMIIETRDGAMFQAFNSHKNVPTLRVELVDFSQVFDRPDASRAVVRLRASVFVARGLVDQRVVQVDVPARSADAAGGVAALTQASDRAIGELLDWAAGLSLSATASATGRSR